MVKCISPILVILPGIIYLGYHRHLEPETSTSSHITLLMKQSSTYLATYDHHFHHSNNYNNNNNNAKQNLNYCKNLQMTLSSISVFGWIYYLLSLQELSESIRCITYFLVWVNIFIVLLGLLGKRFFFVGIGIMYPFLFCIFVIIY